MQNIITVFLVRELKRKESGRSHVVDCIVTSNNGVQHKLKIHDAVCEKEAEDVAASLNNALLHSAYQFDEV